MPLNNTKVQKCLFPAAGYGTRFLPATKAIPKEMLPVLTKPLLQYGVEEAIEAGIETMAIVTGRGKRAIEDHFDRSYELENQINGTSKEILMNDIRTIINNCTFSYTRQVEMKGLGHAILTGDFIQDDILRVNDMVEKPNPKDAPSNLAIIGRYILTPDIFDIIRDTKPGKGGEIQITDALLEQAKQGKVIAYKFKGKRFDCGSVDGFVEATNYFYNKK